MASISSSTMASVAAPAQANMVAPFTGLKSNAAFPATKKANDFSSLPSNGGRVQCMKVWPPLGLKKYETLSYLPTLTEAQLAKEVDYLLRNKWVPCLEFDTDLSTVRTQDPLDTMTEDTGQCGSCLCLDALTPPKC
ncbi:ribulose bisphosphate carboxylase small chain 4, chloroplastic isoform X2 [Helianthus annuus]|uniref:ribulose bisphosphate carboxylase small chain 4, chloroplastic isoform X2 n=1 Tax=Helianthus annuus TaxID=4232 RepID=UPI000B8F4D56|nr:ribulose bisphosphate carboxylase small chain 4, chloroplastic isoform X2 [Helianthus annuus]